MEMMTSRGEIGDARRNRGRTISERSIFRMSQDPPNLSTEVTGRAKLVLGHVNN